MKTISNLLRRLRSRSKRQTKKGASLALVMLVGSLLVIWVMAIMPLMSTSGTVAYTTQGTMLSYLENRSSLEYCKSELKFQVGNRTHSYRPWSFVVVKNGDDYAAYDIQTENGSFNSYVSLDETGKYIPGNDEALAICTVTEERPNYVINITTYSNGKPGLTYTATYSSGGTLKILPESYRGKEALPLSDFVLVDGKLGGKTVWESGITMSHVNQAAAGNIDEALKFEEHLMQMLPAEDFWQVDRNYASSEEFPAVFKTTAHTADMDQTVTLNVLAEKGEMTSDVQYIAPQTQNSGKDGYTAYGTGYGSNNKPNELYVKNGSSKTRITNDIEFYYNGQKDEKPKAGTYSVTVSYPSSEGSKILPFDGFVFANKHSGVSTVTDGSDNKINEDYEVTFVQKTHDEYGNLLTTPLYTATVVRADASNGTVPKNEEGLVCGYIRSDDLNTVHWNKLDEAVFDNLPIKDSKGIDLSYYFYIYKAASYNDNNDGKFHPASSIEFVGMMAKPVVYTGDVAAGSYVIGTLSGSTYKLFNPSNGNITTVQADANGILTTDISGMSWNITAASDGKWNIKNSSGKALTISGEVEHKLDISTTTTRHLHNVTGFWIWEEEEYGDCHTQSNPSFKAVKDVKIALSNNFALTVEKGQNSDFVLSSTLEKDITYSKYDCDYNYRGNNPSSTETITSNPLYVNTNSGSGVSEDKSYVTFFQMPVIPDASKLKPAESNYSLKSTHPTYNPDGIPVSSLINNAGYLERKEIYINGDNNVVNADRDVKLNAGLYHIVVKGEHGFVDLGVATVNKATPGGTLSIKAESTYIPPDPNDPFDNGNNSDRFGINVTVTGLNPAADAGYHYFGYREVGETDFHWYLGEGDTFKFRLDYGSYEFAVKEVGTCNYEGRELLGGATCTITPPDPITLKENESEKLFRFMVNEDGSVTWFALPDGFYSDMVTMYYGYNTTGDPRDGVDNWENEEDYKGEVYETGVFWKTTHYLVQCGVQLDEKYSTNYQEAGKNAEKFNIIKQKLNSTTVDLHKHSMLTGRSAYFMGNPSINTHGANVLLTTDLLILNGPIDHGDGLQDGQVFLQTYSKNVDKVLIFVPDSTDPDLEIYNNQGKLLFKAGNFYQVPSGRDLLSLDPDNGEVIDLGSITADGVINSQVKPLFEETYPEINLDIAFASREQLARIVSSETYNWTENGVLLGGDPAFTGDSNGPTFATEDPRYNQHFCITAYVSSITDGSHSYSANRVLMVAGPPKSDGSAAAQADADQAETTQEYTLNVPGDLYFITRYFSLDADKVTRSETGKFMIYNLGQVESYYTGVLGDEDDEENMVVTYSQTLQLDLERPVIIGGKSYSKQIARIPHGTNLFGAVNSMSVITNYSDKLIHDLMPNKNKHDIVSTLKTVDRYVQITASGADLGDDLDGTSNNKPATTITITSGYIAKLMLYANYVHFDETITEIHVHGRDKIFKQSNVFFGAQETGYSTKEYLGLFTSSDSDSYAGTIVYVGAPNGLLVRYTATGILTGGTETYVNFTIPQGIYRVTNGTTLKDFEAVTGTGDTDTSKIETILKFTWASDPTMSTAYSDGKNRLGDLAVYISPSEGIHPDAFVETGLDSNEFGVTAGFSGGTVG